MSGACTWSCGRWPISASWDSRTREIDAAREVDRRAPKIADYPFTTLTPNLGVAEAGDERFVVADIPGLVEGAHEGKGLGHRFLRHITRCRALVIVVDLSSPDAPSDLETVRAELRAYDPELADRPSLVVGTKVDLVDEPARSRSIRGLPVSAVTGEGLELLATQLEQLSRQGASQLLLAPRTWCSVPAARGSISRVRRVAGRRAQRRAMGARDGSR